jgi:hypothetical protein
MSTRTCRVGVHGRNQEIFHDIDYQVLREAKAEVVKMMSHSRPEVFRRIREENPDTEIITRLYDDRMNTGGHPTPREFADKMIPIMRALQPYCTKFQIHNEPNHAAGIEGWGPTKEHAEDFNRWFLEVYSLLKEACPWASLGFPGLAIPNHLHKDRIWLEACREAIQRADWLGVHSYWQTPTPNQKDQMKDDRLGWTYRYYHNKFPNKILDILECGNSNIHTPGYHTSEEAIAQEYVEWLNEIFKVNYVNSASFFILSSPDPQWDFFAWRTEHNHKKQAVHRVGTMHRPPLVEAGVPVRPPERPPARREVAPVPGKWTNQQIITAFHNAAIKLGLGSWALMSRAGIKLADLVRDRAATYTGTDIADLPNLAPEHKELIQQELVAMALPAGVSFGLEEAPVLLRERTDLALISLDLPRSQHIRLATLKTSTEKQAARMWNRYGYLLLTIADALEIEPGVAVAVLAAQADRRGVDRSGRLVIRFENHIFYEKWGRQNEETFYKHFRFDPTQPWQKHQWRLSTEEEWRDCHTNQEEEWKVFELASSLDGTAAKLSLGMGLAGTMGFNYAAMGYESVGQMFDAFSAGERHQIFAVFDLITADFRQLESLRAKELDVFAVLHYGSQQGARYGSMIRSLYEAFERLTAS